jgi:hypothetical protein
MNYFLCYVMLIEIDLNGQIPLTREFSTTTVLFMHEMITNYRLHYCDSKN